MSFDLISTLETFKNLIQIPSPCGYTRYILKEIKKDFDSIGYTARFTKNDSLLITIPGEHNHKHVTLCTSIATIGAVVSFIDSDGTIRFKTIENTMISSLNNENCTLIKKNDEKLRGSAIICDEDNGYIRLDEKISSKKDVLTLGVNIGDLLYFDPGFEATNTGFIKSRYLDSKLGVSIAIELFRYLKKENICPKYTTHLYIDSLGVSPSFINYLPKEVDEVLYLKPFPVTHKHTSSEYSVSIGSMDSNTIYPFHFRTKVVGYAENKGVDYTIDTLDNSYCICPNINYLCLGPGASNMNNYGRTHVSSIENTMKLLMEYLTQE